MFRLSLRAASLAVALSIGAISGANDVFNVNFDHLSAFQDTSNCYVAGVNYQVQFDHWGTDPFYIDGVNFSGDTAGLNLSLSDLKYANPSASNYDPNNPSQYTYHLGDEIVGDQSWRFNQLAFLEGATGATLGLHAFTMSFMGHYGTDATSDLVDLQCFLFVAPKLDITVTGETSPGTIHAGEKSAMNMTVTNNMTDNAFVSTTWFVSGMSNGSAYLPLDSFDFGPDSSGWFNKNLFYGQSLTLGHSIWTADGTTPAGTYSGENGVVGGIYNGDWYLVSMENHPPINVTTVPGPAALTTMGFGWMMMLLRRRRNR